MVKESKDKAYSVVEDFTIEACPEDNEESNNYQENNLRIMIIKEEPVYEPIKQVPGSKENWLHDKSSKAGLRLIEGSLSYPFLFVKCMSKKEKPEAINNQNKKYHNRTHQISFVSKIEREWGSKLGSTSKGKI